MPRAQAYWKRYGRRAKLLGLAGRMARSGRHEDHRSITAELETVGGFREAPKALTRAVCAQLDRLCALARSRAQDS